MEQLKNHFRTFSNTNVDPPSEESDQERPRQKKHYEWFGCKSSKDLFMLALVQYRYTGWDTDLY